MHPEKYKRCGNTGFAANRHGKGWACEEEHIYGFGEALAGPPLSPDGIIQDPPVTTVIPERVIAASETQDFPPESKQAHRAWAIKT